MICMMRATLASLGFIPGAKQKMPDLVKRKARPMNLWPLGGWPWTMQATFFAGDVAFLNF